MESDSKHVKHIFSDWLHFEPKTKEKRQPLFSVPEISPNLVTFEELTNTGHVCTALQALST